MTFSQVILVDEKDKEIGVMDKMQAHQEGKLHRAFSILVFNSKGEMLIQKRAAEKYHSAGLWTNACCSHPQPLETTIESAKRRLMEEIGLSCSLDFAFKFQYLTEFENGLIESELDHVFVGITNNIPVINPREVSDFKYVSIEELMKDIEENPDQYTYWFRLILKLYIPSMARNG